MIFHTNSFPSKCFLTPYFSLFRSISENILNRKEKYNPLPPAPHALGVCVPISPGRAALPCSSPPNQSWEWAGSDPSSAALEWRSLKGPLQVGPKTSGELKTFPRSLKLKRDSKWDTFGWTHVIVLCLASYKQLAFEDYSADKIHTLFDIFQYLRIFETTTYYSNS